jgi:hypothetical protein
MSNGNLNEKRVSYEFWPRCANCVLYEKCKAGLPRHIAFPHTWHWGREGADFPDGVLILESWVGTVAIGEPHTGCHAYKVAERYLLPLEDKHRQYLELERRRRQMDAKFVNLEKRQVYNDDVIALYDQYEEIMTQQARLVSAA